jgi:uncharacterized membrane protein
MNQDLDNFEKVNDELHDEWLTENLQFAQLEPPQNFTRNVMEQIEVKPNPLSGSPLFWILAIIPGMILIWLILFTLGAVNSSYNLNLDFIPNISSYISLYTLSKYVIMVTIGGLFFIGIDHFISKGLSQRESYFSFLLV